MHENTITFRVWGRQALFSDPITRVGGEKCSYPVPTYEALKGIVKSIYWKPTIIWCIDRVRVMNPFHSQSKGIKLHAFEANDGVAGLSYYTYLHNVSYQVQAHFIWNTYRKEFLEDRNEKKHQSIAKRMLERGGRQDIFLGTRECQGYVEPCIFDEGEGAFDHMEELPLGLMFHGFDYPDETGKDEFVARFWSPVMRKGIIEFPPLDSPQLLRKFIRPMRAKTFAAGKNYNPEEYMSDAHADGTVSYPKADILQQGELL